MIVRIFVKKRLHGTEHAGRCIEWDSKRTVIFGAFPDHSFVADVTVPLIISPEKQVAAARIDWRRKGEAGWTTSLNYENCFVFIASLGDIPERPPEVRTVEISDFCL
jgi:hypothetical protein